MLGLRDGRSHGSAAGAEVRLELSGSRRDPSSVTGQQRRVLAALDRMAQVRDEGAYGEAVRTARRTIDGLGRGRDLPSDEAWLTTLSVIGGMVPEPSVRAIRREAERVAELRGNVDPAETRSTVTREIITACADAAMANGRLSASGAPQTDNRRGPGELRATTSARSNEGALNTQKEFHKIPRTTVLCEKEARPVRALGRRPSPFLAHLDLRKKETRNGREGWEADGTRRARAPGAAACPGLPPPHTGKSEGVWC